VSTLYEIEISCKPSTIGLVVFEVPIVMKPFSKYFESDVITYFFALIF
jgi:hypothetical protein